jgi:hypothetical protein
MQGVDYCGSGGEHADHNFRNLWTVAAAGSLRPVVAKACAYASPLSFVREGRCGFRPVLDASLRRPLRKWEA